MVGIELWVRGRQSLDGLALFEKACLELNKKGMNVCLLTPSKQRILPIQELQNVLSYSNKIVIYRNQVIIESHQTITGNIAVQTTKGIIYKIADILVATPSGAILYKEAQDIAKTRAEMKSKKTKHIVYTSQIESIEDAKVRLLRDFNEEELEDMGIDINDDNSLYDYLSEENRNWLHDEKGNLPHEKLNIVAIATLGLWRGKRTGYKEYPNHSISDMLGEMWGKSIDDIEVYVQGADLKCKQIHHDGTNYIIYRELTNPRLWDKLKEKLYNNQEWSLDELQRCTKGLGDRIRRIYGW